MPATTTVNVGVAGKYAIKHEAGANLRSERYGKPWRNHSGDGLILALAHRIEELEAKLEEFEQARRVAEDEACEVIWFGLVNFGRPDVQVSWRTL